MRNGYINGSADDKDNTIQRVDIRGHRKDGSEFSATISLSKFTIGEQIYSVAALEDVTEIIERNMRSQKLINRRVEKLVQARTEAEKIAKARTEFLANMSHEIRTPLNAIIGMSEMVKDKLSTKPNEAVDLVDKIHLSARSLHHIINDILDYSKIDAGKIEIEAYPFECTAIMRQLDAIFHAFTRKKGLKLELKQEGEFNTALLGDRNRIEQVLVNLVSNAIKFTEQGKVSISISVLPSDHGYQVSFVVADTGLGMDEEELGNVFNAFTQADSSITRRFGGTGLGLYITHKLVELMGGTLSVSSTKGEGTRFEFTLTLPKSEQELGVSYGTSEDGMPLQGKYIVVVDDNEFNLEVATYHLEKLGAEVATFACGLDFLAWLEHKPQAPDAVLLDLQMPNIDGFSVAEQALALPSYGDLTILACSAATSPVERSRARDAGMVGFIGKPYTADKLLQELNKRLVLDDSDGVFDEVADVESASKLPDSPDRALSHVDVHVQENETMGLTLEALPLVDYDAGVEHLQSEEMYLAFLKTYGDTYGNSKDEFSQLFANGDFEGIKKAAHKLRGAASAMMLLRLTQQLKQAENVIADTSVLDQATFEQLTDCISATEEKIKVILQQEDH
ncbi:ATP-binding protein [Maribrevibacterium harenarium]|uniref:ATP-binding protein n=1 Tax=Maribrevibacterium harenarium TaxID=2589817 RepID=UPI0015E38818|nr:ATP-binding protein [Maribrevibacterium harenarium]